MYIRAADSYYTEPGNTEPYTSFNRIGKFSNLVFGTEASFDLSYSCTVS